MWKHILWVLNELVLMRQLQWVPTRYFGKKNNKLIFSILFLHRLTCFEIWTHSCLGFTWIPRWNSILYLFSNNQWDSQYSCTLNLKRTYRMHYYHSHFHSERPLVYCTYFLNALAHLDDFTCQAVEYCAYIIIRIDSVTNIAVFMGPADNYYKNNRWKSPKWYFAGLMGHKNPKKFHNEIFNLFTFFNNIKS